MDRLTQLHQNMDEMTQMFASKMKSFEESLSRSPAKDVSSLASEFQIFKTFIWKAVTGLKTQMELVLESLDSIEMKSRANILLLHGVVEKNDEDIPSDFIKLCKGALNLSNFVPHSLCLAFRLGRNISSTKPRPILLRFMDQQVRNTVWAAKKRLKGSGLTLSEFLTNVRHAVFVEARKSLGIKGCWTSGSGKVVVVRPNGEKIRVMKMADLRSVLEEHARAKKRDNISTAEKPASSDLVEPPAKPPSKPRSIRAQSKTRKT